MKKQYNYYMDEKVKEMIECIRMNDPNYLIMLSDSQIVEYIIRSYADLNGYSTKKKEPD